MHHSASVTLCPLTLAFFLFGCNKIIIWRKKRFLTSFMLCSDTQTTTLRKVVVYGVYLKFPATTSRERLLRNHWDLDAHGGGKECLSKTSRVSSLRWDLICPNQLMVLKKRILLGVSSSWDSRPAISVRGTESSTVDTMRCCERRVNCSARREPTNIRLRSRKVCRWLSICWMTLCCEGMKQHQYWRQNSHPTQRKTQRGG